MTPLTPANHLAARMGRWSATHRKTAILGWLAFVLTALVLGSLVGTEKLDPSMSTIGESGRADAVLADRFDKPLVERVLVEHPAVAAGAVLGVPDERLGERVAAVVQPAAGAAVDVDDVRAHLLANLARYKVPEQITVVDALPRNAMGKITRTDLPALLGPATRP
jgi:hypothetical protein